MELKILCLVDNSATSAYAFDWLMAHFLLVNNETQLTILSVSVPRFTPDFVEDSTADERDRANLEALNIAERYRDVAIANGISVDRIRVDVATAGNGVGKEVAHFCSQEPEAFDMCVCGSRGMGAAKRAMAGVAEKFGLGLGSVSDYCVHHLKMPVVIVRGPPRSPAPAGGAPQSSAAAPTTSAFTAIGPPEFAEDIHGGTAAASGTATAAGGRASSESANNAVMGVVNDAPKTVLEPPDPQQTLTTGGGHGGGVQE